MWPFRTEVRSIIYSGKWTNTLDFIPAGGLL